MNSQIRLDGTHLRRSSGECCDCLLLTGNTLEIGPRFDSAFLCISLGRVECFVAKMDDREMVRACGNAARNPFANRSRADIALMSKSSKERRVACRFRRKKFRVT